MKLTQTFKPLLLSAACAALFAGCATTGTSEAVEAARLEVNAAATNPEVIARAPLELRTAQEALDRAANAHRDGADRVDVNHHAYLAQTRANTARNLASARSATDELSRTQAEVDRLRLVARTQEAQIARSQAAIAGQQAASASQQAALSAQQAEAARLQAQAATQQAQASSQDALAASQQAALERNRANQASLEAGAAQQRVAALQSQLNELQARETERGLLVTLGDVLFAFNRAELLPTALPRLDKLADFLKQFPDKSLLIEGYTDAVGSDGYNRELSQRRAEAVRTALVERGVNSARITARGYGEAYPVAANSSPEGRQMNRRVEVVVTDDRGNLKPRG